MSEHWIRLRGGWEWHELGEGDARLRRVTLPLSLAPGPPSLVRFVRPFQGPRLDPLRETLVLRMERVEGLEAVWLNGREIARPPQGTTALELPLDTPLPARNRLVLEVHAPLPSDSHQVASSWGAIALVIRPRLDPPEDCPPAAPAQGLPPSPRRDEEPLGGTGGRV